MPVQVELHIDGSRIRSVPDPAGGTFDAAGDFDRLMGDARLPVLGSVETNEITRLGAQQMRALLDDIALAKTGAMSGQEARGLERLRILAEWCLDRPGSELVFIGD